MTLIQCVFVDNRQHELQTIAVRTINCAQEPTITHIKPWFFINSTKTM